MKIIIYGVEDNSYYLERLIKQDHQIVGYISDYEIGNEYIDKYHHTSYKISDINNLNFDVIIIVATDRRIADRIKLRLEHEFHVETNRILYFYDLFSEPKIDAVMSKYDITYDGLILGLSHAAFGINPQYLEGSWCNLANGSQDIYYNKCMIEHCIKKYPEKIRNLKHVVIDMYDYIYFNWDVSLSKMILYYFAHGGYCYDLHHFSENINYPLSLEQEMKKHGYYYNCDIEKKMYYRKLLFQENIVEMKINEMYCNYEFSFYSDFQNKNLISSHISEEFKVNPGFFETTLFTKRFETTIQRNIKAFEELIRLLYTVNSNMNIEIILMPRYYLLENLESKLAYMLDWKKDFEHMVNGFVRKYHIKYRNLKNLYKISFNYKYYLDECHLNYDGSTEFTKYLNMLIFHIEKSNNKI